MGFGFLGSGDHGERTWKGHARVVKFAAREHFEFGTTRAVGCVSWRGNHKVKNPEEDGGAK